MHATSIFLFFPQFIRYKVFNVIYTSVTGHVITDVPEIPLVVADSVQSFKKTKEAVALLKKLKCWDDVMKVKKSRTVRAGRGKMRNRRFTQKRGMCVIYDQDEGITKAFRNIPG